jgi:transposase-like protein
MRTSARTRYAGYRFPTEIISHAVWLYFRFPLGLRMVEGPCDARRVPMIGDHSSMTKATLTVSKRTENSQD